MREGACTWGENQSREGKGYAPGVRTNHVREGVCTWGENQSRERKGYILAVENNHAKGRDVCVG